MWLQMKLSPQPSGSDDMQKMQKKIFGLMPFFLTFVLAPFASGLVLYWCISNCLTIIQQGYLKSQSELEAERQNSKKKYVKQFSQDKEALANEIINTFNFEYVE